MHSFNIFKMPLSGATERCGLEVLWEKLHMARGVRSDGHLANMDDFQIVYETQKDREGSVSKFDGRDKTPQSFFQTPTEILAQYPIDFDRNRFLYFEYESLKEKSIETRTDAVANYMSHRAVEFKRVGTTNVGKILGIWPIEYPSPFYLGSDVDASGWRVETLHEIVKAYSTTRHAHIILQVSNEFDGKEDCILFSELISLVAVMRNRANQLKINDESEQEALHESDNIDDIDDIQEKIDKYGLEFPDEKHFPTLMLSYVGPQHGRYFYACMNKSTLLIWQSKLFDFTKLVPAQFDVFTNLLLSQPSDEK